MPTDGVREGGAVGGSAGSSKPGRGGNANCAIPGCSVPEVERVNEVAGYRSLEGEDLGKERVFGRMGTIR